MVKRPPFPSPRPRTRIFSSAALQWQQQHQGGLPRPPSAAPRDLEGDRSIGSVRAPRAGGTVRGVPAGKAEPGESFPHVTAIMSAPRCRCVTLSRARRSFLPPDCLSSVLALCARPRIDRFVFSWRLGGRQPCTVAAPALSADAARAASPCRRAGPFRGKGGAAPP